MSQSSTVYVHGEQQEQQ